MNDIEWFLDILDNDLEDAEKKLFNETKKSPQSIINLLAIRFLRKDYSGILALTDEVFGRKDIPFSVLTKILEYRIIASIYLKKPAEILKSLNALRTQLLIFYVEDIPPAIIASIKQLLEDPTIVFLRRYHSMTKHSSVSPLTKIVSIMIHKACQDSLFENLPPVEKSQAYALSSILMPSILRTSDAIKYLDRAIRLQDGYIPRAAAGKIYFIIGNPSRAFNELNYALKFSDDDPLKGYEAKVNLAQLYSLQGDYKTALKYITDALRIRQEPIARLIRGEILLNLGELDAAIVAFRALVNIGDSRILLRTLINLAACLLEKNNVRKAFDYLWKAHLMVPDNEYIGMLASALKELSENR